MPIVVVNTQVEINTIALSDTQTALDICQRNIFALATERKGVYGVVMNKLEFPITPIILGFILGPLAETNLRRALMLSRGALLPLVSNTPSIVLIALSVLSLILAPRLLAKEAAASIDIKEADDEGEI